jgi:hypothetical protein
MRNTIYSNLKKNLLITSIVFASILEIVYAQPPVPNMWIDSGRSKARIASYSSKNQLLSAYIKKKEADSIFFPGKSFRALIDTFENTKKFGALRVYIASYGNENTTVVPAGFGNLLTLIFAPVDLNGKELGSYYSIIPNGKFDAKSDSCNLKPGIVAEWRDSNYIAKKIPVLLPTITNIPDNQAKGVFSDTRSIVYPEPYIKQLIKEIEYQHANGIDISGVRAFFAAYTATGNEDNNNRFANRLIIQFEFTKNVNDKHVTFYLENTTGFNQRPPKLPPVSGGFGLLKPYMNFLLDNGQLCPPTCP